LNTQLGTPLNLPKDASIESVLDSLAKSTTKQIVLILDQFERVVNQHPSTQEADRFVGNLRSLFQSQHDNLNVICVSSVSANEGGRLLFSMMQVKNFWEGPLNVGDLAPDLVREFIIGWTSKAEITFEPALIERLLADYAKSLESDRTFSLAHVQAVCNIICRKGDLSLAGYLDVLETERAVLDLTINHCDFINFIEDVPSQERALLRNIVRTISHTECNQRIVDYVRDYVAELLDGEAPRTSSQLIN